MELKGKFKCFLNVNGFPTLQPELLPISSQLGLLNP